MCVRVDGVRVLFVLMLGLALGLSGRGGGRVLAQRVSPESQEWQQSLAAAPQTKAGGSDPAVALPDRSDRTAGPDRPDQGCGISGRVFDAGVPAAAVALDLYEHKPGARGSTVERGRAVSDAEGRYRFPPVRGLEPGRALYVRYFNKRSDPAVDDRRLAAWYGADVRSLGPDGCADGGEFDLADVPLTAPDAGQLVSWGAPFDWQSRVLAAGRDPDAFQVCFADWTSRAQIACAPSKARAGNRYAPSPSERPAAIIDRVAYGWYLLVARDGDAFGYSRWQRRIDFLPSPSATPTRTPTPSATPAAGGIPTVMTVEPSPTVPPMRTTVVPVEPSATLPPPDATVCPGYVVKGTMDVRLPDKPLRADVLLVFDATGSMGAVIASAKANAQQIVDTMASVVPDVRFAVAYFRDYSDTDVYRLVQPMTPDGGAVGAAIGSFGAGGGGADGPEAYSLALYQAYEDPAVGWRADSRRFVMVFGDNMPRDDDLNEGITDPTVNSHGTWCGDAVPDCQRDPGLDLSYGTADDLDFQTVLHEMQRHEMTLLFVASAPDYPDWKETLLAYWSQWASWTSPGGAAVALENTADLPRTIADLVRNASAKIGRLVIEARPPEYAGWLTTRPDEMLNILVPPGGTTVSFDYELKLPDTVPVPSTHVIYLRAIGDGAEYALRRIVLDVPLVCIKPPTVQPSGHFIIGVPASALRDFPGTWSSVGRQLRRGGPASGRANSALQVQNLDGERTLNARAYFFPQRIPYTRAKGSPPPQAFPVEMLGVPPGASYNMFLPRLSLPFGIFSAVMLDDIDLPLAAVVRTDWTETGAAALYTSVRPSYEQMLPVVLRRYYGQTSVISVMSDGNDRPIDVELSFYRSGSATPLSPMLRFELQPYEGATFDLLDQHPAFQALGVGFVGSARLRTVYGPDPGRLDDGAWIGAVSHVNIGSSKRAVWGFEAQPSGVGSSKAAEKLFVPLWRSRQRGAQPSDRLDTGIAVVNPNDREVEVVVDFYTTDNLSASDACRSMASFSTSPVRIAARSNHVFYQGPGGGSFPDNCFGSAVVRTTNAGDTVLAVVNDAQNLNQLSAAYNAVAADDAAKKIAVPLFRNRHGRNELTTGIQVMNTGPRTAQVHIDFISPIGSGGTLINGCSIACDAIIPSLRSYTFYPPAIEAIAPNTAGSAIIDSTEPAVAIVIDYPLKGCCVDSAAYLGLPWYDVPEPGKPPLANGRRNPHSSPRVDFP